MNSSKDVVSAGGFVVEKGHSFRRAQKKGGGFGHLEKVPPQQKKKDSHKEKWQQGTKESTKP